MTLFGIPAAPRPLPEQSRVRGLPFAADLVELLRAPAEEHPEGEIVHLCHHGGQPETLTWGGLWRAARVVAGRLRRAGVQPGDRVLLVLPTCREFLESFFGILAAGAVPVPAAPPATLRGEELDHHLEMLRSLAGDSGAVACVSLPRLELLLRASLLAANPAMIVLTPEPGRGAEPLADVYRPSPPEVAFLQYTSGSTSRPKGVVLTHGNIVANANGVSQLLFEPEALCITWLPLYHDMGLIGTVLTALYCRVPTVIMSPQAFIKAPGLWLRRISDHRATITAAPNFAFGYCVKYLESEELAGVRLDSLRVALNGAEPVDAMAVERFHEKFRPLGLRDGVVRPCYGLAESSLAVTFSDPGPYRVDTVDAERLERDSVAVPASNGARHSTFISVGRPIPGQSVRIADEDGRTLPDRRVGEILVNGESVMKGYHNQPAETAAALRGGWLRTGDLGYMADDRLFITGRAKDLIIRHGRNYYPQDLESQVTRLEGVRKGGAVAFSLESGSETRVVLVAESRIRDEAALEDLARRIRERIQASVLFGPDDVRIVPPGTIPRTTSGKVRRQECKARYLNGELRPGSRGGYVTTVRWLLRSLRSDRAARRGAAEPART